MTSSLLNKASRLNSDFKLLIRKNHCSSCLHNCGIRIQQSAFIHLCIACLFQKNTSVECPSCPDTFTTHHGLAIHTALKHRGSSIIGPKKSRNIDQPRCPECDKSCASSTGLNLHMRLAHGKTTRLNFACDQCPKTFSIKADLQKHYRKAHKAKGAFQCRMCEDSFMTSRSLRQQIIFRLIRFSCE